MRRAVGIFHQAIGNGVLIHETVVDLDSVASAIGYSYLTPKKPAIGLIQTPRPDLNLRAENHAALSLAKVSEDDLLTIDDIGVEPSKLASSYALVDHNSLLPAFDRPDVKVTGIIDHHEDEGKHTDASPRNITTPLGSCASLLALTFKDAFNPGAEDGSNPPHELATLLLSAIYIDTGGLKAGGKAEEIDQLAAQFLETYAGHGSLIEGDTSFRKATAKELSEKKHSVAHLSSRDLLRRDYKEYAFLTGDGIPLSVGLSTVPFGTKPWLVKEADATPGYRASLEAWAKERRLDVVGVLNTFKSANKGHHRRELLILVGGGIDAPLESVSSNVKANVDEISQALVAGLEDTKTLKLDKQKLKDDYADIKGPAGDHAHAKEVVGVVHFWRQNNTEGTRKVIAPAFKSIIEGITGVKSTFAP